MNEENRRARAESHKRLAEKCHLAQGTMMEVAGEAIEHLIDNYEPAKHEFFEHDFVFMMASGFRGHHKRLRCPMGNTEAFYKGDMHMFSHVLADHMRQNPEFASTIFHAIEVYSKQQCGHGGAESAADDEE